MTTYRAGDFRSAQCLELLAEADVVVTNPPFSLFREYFSTIKQKEFLVLGPLMAVWYEAVWPFMKSGAVHWGYNKVSEYTGGRRACARWYTTFPVQAPVLELQARYSPERYPFYENYPSAIEVERVSEIPIDFDGPMGVPCTIFGWDLSEFEIVGASAGFEPPYFFKRIKGLDRAFNPLVNGKALFTRVFIRRLPDVRIET